MSNIYITKEDSAKILKFKTTHIYEYLDLLECKNPFCDCTDCQLVFLTKKEYKDKTADGVPLYINILQEKIELVSLYPLTKEQKNHSAILKTELEKTLQKEDWELLRSIHKERKEKQIENINVVDAAENYNFSKEHLLDGNLMISYKEIFPFCKLFKLEKDGIEYEIIEDYCKKINCDCTEINIHLFSKDEQLLDFKYDYKTRKISNIKHEWVISKLIESQVGLFEHIRIRDLTVKNLYTRNLLRIKQEYIESKDITRINNKIGRNEKCPCGSGKKYKKCCLNK